MPSSSAPSPYRCQLPPCLQHCFLVLSLPGSQHPAVPRSEEMFRTAKCMCRWRGPTAGVSCGWRGPHPHEGLHFVEIFLNIFPTPKSSDQFHLFLMSEPCLLVQQTVFMLHGKRCSCWLRFCLFLSIYCSLLSSYLYLFITIAPIFLIC